MNASGGGALVCHVEDGSTLGGSLGRRNFKEPDGVPCLGRMAVGLGFLGRFVAGVVACCCLYTIPLLILCSMASLFTFLLSFSLSLHGFYATGCSVKVLLECESSSPTSDLFRLVDVLLELWVPGTGCILQGGFKHGGVDSCSDFKVPSQKTKHSVSFPGVIQTCLDDVRLFVKVTTKYLLSPVVLRALAVQYMCSLESLLDLVRHDPHDTDLAGLNSICNQSITPAFMHAEANIACTRFNLTWVKLNLAD